MVVRITRPIQVTVAVPFYGTAAVTLRRCLNSIVDGSGADAPSFEILLLNDGGSSPDLKKTARACKKAGIPFRSLSHGSNLGLLEARRTLAAAAEGAYITFVDSDDTLPPHALSRLYRAAQASSADITHGHAQTRAGFSHEHPAANTELTKRIACVHEGMLYGGDIFTNCFAAEGHHQFMWAKLMRTALVRKAFEDIPRAYCVLLEDTLIYFFITRHAQSYCGIPDYVYTYHPDAGITSNRKITALRQWEAVCSAVSVFTILFAFHQDNPLPPLVYKRLNGTYQKTLADTIRKLEHAVDPSIQEKARAMLIDYWGEEAVQNAKPH